MVTVILVLERWRKKDQEVKLSFSKIASSGHTGLRRDYRDFF